MNIVYLYLFNAVLRENMPYYVIYLYSIYMFNLL